MTAPAEAACRLGWALALGAGTGLIYGFLRPLRPKHTLLADGLFLLAVLRSWLELSFGVSRGDIRLGETLGMAVGALAWEAGPGRLFRPVFRRFWHWVDRGAAAVGMPVKNF